MRARKESEYVPSATEGFALGSAAAADGDGGATGDAFEQAATVNAQAVIRTRLGFFMHPPGETAVISVSRR
jgi:hypothetical protein